MSMSETLMQGVSVWESGSSCESKFGWLCKFSLVLQKKKGLKSGSELVLTSDSELMLMSESELMSSSEALSEWVCR